MALKDLLKKSSGGHDAAHSDKPQSGDESTLPPSATTSINEQNEKSSDGDALPHSSTTKHEATANTSQNALERRISEIEQEAEDESQYPKKMQLALITIALCLSVFCFALDNTIISTAIPRITDEFHAINDVGWYGSSYLLTTCAFQLFYGKLYTFFSLKWVFLIALIIFEIGSALCGAAPSSTAFIIGRAIAGLGTGGLFSGAILIIANTVPMRQRPTYTGLIGGMYGIASVAGPLLGGAFTDRVTWRWCFYINLPFGAITLAFILFFYHPTKSARSLGGDTSLAEKLAKFDLWGTAVFLPMVICLLLALQWGGSTYAWSNGRIIALFVIFGVLAIVFVFIQFHKQDNATVPPRVFKQRTTWSASVFAIFLGSSFFIFVYYIPIWFQAIKGTTAVQSGIDNIPMILSLVIASMVAGGLVSTLGYYTPFFIASAIFMAIGGGLFTTFTINTNTGEWIGFQIIYGVGIGMGMQQGLIAVQTALPEADVPIGTALIMFAQTLGGALFISVGTNVFTNRLVTNIVADVPELDPALILSTGATQLVERFASSPYLPAVQNAYNSALVSAFYVGTAMACLSIVPAVFVEWKSVKGKKIEMAAA